MSDDGTRIAIGASGKTGYVSLGTQLMLYHPFAFSHQPQNGYVRVYDLINDSWVQVGEDISCEVISEYADKLPILGVCLGHQCIAQVFGGKVDNADRLMHGKISQVYHTGQGIFQGVPSPFEATRYHSLIAREETLPDRLEVTAYTSDGEVMGVKLTDRPVEGVQFHPESILTEHGKQLLSTFLRTR